MTSAAGASISTFRLQKRKVVSLLSVTRLFPLRGVVGPLGLNMFGTLPYIAIGNKNPIAKRGHRKYNGGVVRPRAGFSEIQNKYKENETFRTFYKILSLACRGGPPPAGEENFVECSESFIFLVVIFYFAGAGIWADTSTVVFSVAAFSHWVF